MELLVIAILFISIVFEVGGFLHGIDKKDGLLAILIGIMIQVGVYLFIKIFAKDNIWLNDIINSL